MDVTSPKHFLICVLDWGLGHATRCIPIINELIKHNQKVSIAGSGLSLTLLKNEFPQLNTYEIPPYSVKYSRSGLFFLNLSWQVPKILFAIQKEHKAVKDLIQSIQPDVIISDNRYGCYSDKLTSIFITHQLNIQLPTAIRWCSGLLNYLHIQLIKKFSVCWIPDYPEQTLSGALSRHKNLKTKFIGPLSRFSYHQPTVNKDLIVGLVSGPEPQRTLFENLLVKEFSKLNSSSVILCGKPNHSGAEKNIGQVKLISHLPSGEMESLIASAGVVVARSGYSTLMDLCVLQKQRIILIPTPGQTEQEYLAKELNSKNIAYSETQHKFNLAHALSYTEGYHGFANWNAGVNLLQEALNPYLNNIK